MRSALLAIYEVEYSFYDARLHHVAQVVFRLLYGNDGGLVYQHRQFRMTYRHAFEELVKVWGVFDDRLSFHCKQSEPLRAIVQMNRLTFPMQVKRSSWQARRFLQEISLEVL